MQLDIRRVSKRYANGVQALNNVSLSVPPGIDPPHKLIDRDTSDNVVDITQ